MSAAEVLRRELERIVQEWLAEVRNGVAAAAAYDDATLIDNTPKLLLAICDLLEPPTSERESALLVDACVVHARQRSKLTHYTVEAVLQEHQILREILYDVLQTERNITVAESRVVSYAIFRGMREAATAFTSIQVGTLKDTIADLQKERRLREHFVLTLTHDLRQPLTAAKASVQLMLRSRDLLQTYTLAHKTLGHITRIDSMVRDLLDASLIRAGQKLPLTLTEMDLDGLLTGIIDDLSTTFGERFILDLQPTRGWWDERGLRRAVENLLTNALKYGSGDEPVTVSVRQTDAQVSISVHNRGEPISRERQQSLFQLFVRGDHTSRGWGLGLTLVKGIAEAHGGGVSVVSAENDGTVFTLTLPRDARPFITAVPQTPTSPVSSSTGS